MYVLASVLIVVIGVLLALAINKKLFPCQTSETKEDPAQPELNNNIQKAPTTAPVPLRAKPAL